jgi:hypothetical protein
MSHLAPTVERRRIKMSTRETDRLKRATESLQRHLDPVEFADLNGPQVTTLIRDLVAVWAQSYGFISDTEKRSLATRTKHTGHRWPGFLNVIGTHPSGLRLAIEIDRTNKAWSIEKLAAEAHQGAVAIWVKWGAPTGLSLIPPTVGVVELHVGCTINKTTAPVQRSEALASPGAIEQRILMHGMSFTTRATGRHT